MIRLVAALVLLPVVASAQQGFQLPSGNIHCQLWEGTLRCDILRFNYPHPARPRDCDAGWGGSVALTAQGYAELICHSDTLAQSGMPVLRYGNAWQGPGMSCTASQSGLRCVNRAGFGFEMARARLRLF
jgi:hypothetical protein